MASRERILNRLTAAGIPVIELPRGLLAVETAFAAQLNALFPRDTAYLAWLAKDYRCTPVGLAGSMVAWAVNRGPFSDDKLRLPTSVLHSLPERKLESGPTYHSNATVPYPGRIFFPTGPFSTVREDYQITVPYIYGNGGNPAGSSHVTAFFGVEVMGVRVGHKLQHRKFNVSDENKAGEDCYSFQSGGVDHISASEDPQWLPKYGSKPYSHTYTSVWWNSRDPRFVVDGYPNVKPTYGRAFRLVYGPAIFDYGEVCDQFEIFFVSDKTMGADLQGQANRLQGADKINMERELAKLRASTGGNVVLQHKSGDLHSADLDLFEVKDTVVEPDIYWGNLFSSDWKYAPVTGDVQPELLKDVFAGVTYVVRCTAQGIEYREPVAADLPVEWKFIASGPAKRALSTWIAGGATINRAPDVVTAGATALIEYVDGVLASGKYDPAAFDGPLDVFTPEGALKYLARGLVVAKQDPKHTLLGVSTTRFAGDL